MSNSFATPWTLTPRLLCPCDFPGKNIGVGCRFLLQGIFLTQGSNPHHLPGRWILYHWASREALYRVFYLMTKTYVLYWRENGDIHVNTVIQNVMKVWNVNHSVKSGSLWPYGLDLQGSCPWNSPGKNAGVGCYSLLQGIYLTQRFNTSLLHWRQILYHLSHQESPGALKRTNLSWGKVWEPEMDMCLPVTCLSSATVNQRGLLL